MSTGRRQHWSECGSRVEVVRGGWADSRRNDDRAGVGEVRVVLGNHRGALGALQDITMAADGRPCHPDIVALLRYGYDPKHRGAVGWIKPGEVLQQVILAGAVGVAGGTRELIGGSAAAAKVLGAPRIRNSVTDIVSRAGENEFEGADIESRALRPHYAALIVRRGAHAGTGIDCRTAGKQGAGESGPAVISQRTKQWIHVEQIAGGSETAAAAIVGSDQVIAKRSEVARDIRAAASGLVIGNDRIQKLSGTANAAAIAGLAGQAWHTIFGSAFGSGLAGRIAANGAIDECPCSGDAATTAAVTAVATRSPPDRITVVVIVSTQTTAAREIAIDRTVDEYPSSRKG